MKNKEIDILRSKIKEANNVVITTHRHPDGDAIGSTLGLYHFLKKSGKRLTLIVPDDYPTFLKWLSGSDEILIHEQQAKKADREIVNADLIFALDYNHFSRTEQMEKKLTSASCFKVLIDHHPQPDNQEFDLSFSREDYSSTAEILFTLLQSMSSLGNVDQHAATSFYTGIMTDTGSFSYSVNRPELFENVAELIRRGADAEKINRNIYDTYSESRLRLLGFCLSERMKVIPEYSTAYIYLSQEDMKRFNYSDGDSEGLVNYGLSIKGINFSALIKEHEGVVRMSLRSKEGFSVNKFARDNFDGGGHQKAAGANSDLGLEDTIRKLESLLPKYKKQLNALTEEE